MSGDPLLDPAWNALATEHARLAFGDGRARRYPAVVVPFAALADQSAASWADLKGLLTPVEHVYLFGAQPAGTNGLKVGTPLHTYQMVWPLHKPIEPDRDEMSIVPMTATDADAMVALTTLAFPGFFATGRMRWENITGFGSTGNWWRWLANGWRCPGCVRSARW